MAEELEKIAQLLQELTTNQALHALEQKGIREDLDRVVHLLIEGNGKPPMTVRLALLEDHVGQIEKGQDEEREQKSMPRSVWVALVVSTLMSIVGIAVSVF